MVQTKIFSEDFDKPHIDVQINKWLVKNPDHIVVDVKFDSVLVNLSVNFSEVKSVVHSALVIYREYENV